ncbi:hypothetical protein [Streptomyces luteireticuli]|uniref:DUF2637 domain-containing protein n=1 Tax=Streptomyces luteireticuli TaxID=173858 RepID=A0ABP3IUX1_9ACTN
MSAAEQGKSLPWYLWVVLVAALGMSAPGEYDLAVVAGWSPWAAWVMPLVVSAYGAGAADLVARFPKGSPERRAAVKGAAGALVLALAVQVTAHLISAGYMTSSAWLVAAVSATPPLVVGHLMHLPRPSAAAVSTAPDTLAAAPRPVAVPEATGWETDVDQTHGRVADRLENAATATAVEHSVAAVKGGDRPAAEAPVAAAIGSEAAAGPEGDHVVVAGPAAAATQEAMVVVPSKPRPAEATATLDSSSGAETDEAVLPGLDDVTARPRRRPAATRSVPGKQDIQAAAAILAARGEPVTGKTLGEHFGVAERTGRRYLAGVAV